MASLSSPYGIQPISDQGGTLRPLRMPFGIASGYAQNIWQFSAVTLNPATGTLTLVTNPGGVPQPIFGIFGGIEYTPLGGRPAFSKYWPSGTAYDPNFDMLVYLWPCWLPGLRFRVQADGSVPQSAMGSQFNITNATAGNAIPGTGQCTVGAAGVAAGSQGQFALVEFDNSVGDAIGDAFTDLICTIAYPQVGLGSQKSIG